MIFKTLFICLSRCNHANVICRHFSGWTSSKLYLQSCCFFSSRARKEITESLIRISRRVLVAFLPLLFLVWRHI